MPKVLSFGDRIRPGRYALHSRFDRAVNFLQEGRLASLVAPEVGGGPVNIVLQGLDLSRLKSLEVRADGFVLDGAAFPKSPLFDSALPPRSGAEPRLPLLRELLLRKAHPKSLAFLLDESRRQALDSGFERVLAAQLQDAAEDLRAGDLETGARAAAGAGFGLTPSGDDLLAGFLWGLHERRRLCGGDFSRDIARVYAAACGIGSSAGPGRTDVLAAGARGANPLSAAFLDSAREGRFFERLRALLTGQSSLEEGLDAVLAVGETSGADTCVGVLLALEKEASLWS
ncbi:MAG: DUF2877 domain-containing protein [Elusimicrobia bacterium]|nr:DUF2877 domain-containing protein [Elusimicrobiota bacterium]